MLSPRKPALCSSSLSPERRKTVIFSWKVHGFSLILSPPSPPKFCTGLLLLKNTPSQITCLQTVLLAFGVSTGELLTTILPAWALLVLRRNCSLSCSDGSLDVWKQSVRIPAAELQSSTFPLGQISPRAALSSQRPVDLWSFKPGSGAGVGAGE